MLYKTIMKHQRIVTFFALAALFLLLQYIFTPEQIDPIYTLFNFLLILPIFGLSLLLFRRNSAALFITALFLSFVDYIDGVVFSGRLTHIRYSDLFAIKDAMRVAKRYAITFTGRNAVLLGVVLAVSGLFIFVSLRFPEKQSKRENAVVGGSILILSVIFLVCGTVFKWIPDPTRSIDDQFDANGLVDRVGLYYAVYGQFRNSHIEMPEGYSEEKVEAILTQFPSSEEAIEPIRIIVIMNEALADYSLIGETAFTDPLANIHNPDNSFFEGKLAVSVFGGYTCNSEYEFLTGNSMQFLPNGCIPFTQLVVSKQLSLAWEMKALGLSTDGIHPYYSQEWNRRHVYACLGFDRFVAGEDFSSGLSVDNANTNITDTQLTTLNFGNDLEYIRGFISDAECYRKVSEVLDDGDMLSFVFAVTVQNHGGYRYDGSDFTCEKYIDNADDLNQYLTCASISDVAFCDFIHDLQDSQEKTVVLMFGDHQPGLDFSQYVNGFNSGIDCFFVPYILWCNFELSYEPPALTSANYLSAILKACADLPLSSWDQLRLDVMQNYPVITGNFILNDMGEMISKEDMQSSELLKEYEIVQYYRMFSAADH